MRRPVECAKKRLSFLSVPSQLGKKRRVGHHIYSCNEPSSPRRPTRRTPVRCPVCARNTTMQAKRVSKTEPDRRQPRERDAEADVRRGLSAGRIIRCIRDTSLRSQLLAATAAALATSRSTKSATQRATARRSSSARQAVSCSDCAASATPRRAATSQSKPSR